MTNNVVNTGSIRFHTPRSSKIYCSERGWLIWHRASVLDSGANLSPSMVVAIAVSANATAIGIFVWGSCGSVFRRLLPPPPPFSSPTCPHTTCTHTQLVITHLFTQLSHTHFVTHNFAHTHPLSSPTWPHTTCALKLRSHMGHMSSVLRECQQTCFIMAPKTGPKKLLKLR